MFCKHEPAAREALPGNTDLAAQDCGCCCPALVNIPWRENSSFLQLQHAGSSACASREGPASPWHGIQSCQPCPAGHTSSVHLSHQARTEASPWDGSDHGSHATPVPALWEPFPVADDECVRHRVTGCELSDTSVFRGSSALCDARGDAPGPVLSPGGGIRARSCSGCGSGAGRVGRSRGCRLKEVTLLQSALLRSLSSHGVNGINQRNL